MFSPRTRRPGVSLLEMMVVIVIFAITTIAVIPLLSIYSEKQTISSVTVDLVQTVRRAQSRSLSGTLGETWGIYVMPGDVGYVLFSGDSYSLNHGTGTNTLGFTQQEEIHPLPTPFRICIGGDVNDSRSIVFPHLISAQNTRVYFQIYLQDETSADTERFVLVDSNGSVTVARTHNERCDS